MSVRFVQPSKALQPILVTPYGMVIFLRPVQSSKAFQLILVTLFGMLMLVRLVHL